MTEEKLKLEAEEYCANNCGDCYGCHKNTGKNKNCEKIKSMIKTYLLAAIPREKLLQEKDKKIEELEAQLSLKIINCIKSHLCKQDEDYDKAIISPKFLSDALDQMYIDGFKEIKND